MRCAPAVGRAVMMPRRRTASTTASVRSSRVTGATVSIAPHGTPVRKSATRPSPRTHPGTRGPPPVRLPSGAPRSHRLVHRSREQQVVPIARLAPRHGPRAVVVRARLVRQRRELHHGGKRANARRDLSHAQGCISHKSRARFRRELPSAELVSRPENEVTTNRGSFRSRGALLRAIQRASRRGARPVSFVTDAPDAVTEPLRTHTPVTSRRGPIAPRGSERPRARAFVASSPLPRIDVGRVRRSRVAPKPVAAIRLSLIHI